MYKIKYKHSNYAFTLVELSIVIVIIGLIIAGVTAGSSLVSNAKLRAQAADIQMYSTAFNVFYGQYNAIAGDMKNASSYWQSATDGNGNGYLDSNNDPVDPTNLTIELYTLFQHLSLAQLIPIQYNNTYLLGTGYPTLKIDKKKGMIAANQLNVASYSSVYQVSTAKKHKAALYINVSAPANTNTGFNDGGIMSPKQAYAIDRKIDDGIARQGLFRSYTAYGPGNSSNFCLTGVDSDYLQTNTSIVCQSEYVLRD